MPDWLMLPGIVLVWILARMAWLHDIRREIRKGRNDDR